MLILKIRYKLLQASFLMRGQPRNADVQTARRSFLLCMLMIWWWPSCAILSLTASGTQSNLTFARGPRVQRGQQRDPPPAEGFHLRKEGVGLGGGVVAEERRVVLKLHALDKLAQPLGSFAKSSGLSLRHSPTAEVKMGCVLVHSAERSEVVMVDEAMLSRMVTGPESIVPPFSFRYVTRSASIPSPRLYRWEARREVEVATEGLDGQLMVPVYLYLSVSSRKRKAR